MPNLRLISWIFLGVVIIIVGLTLAGCGEKPCNRAGDFKSENGTAYVCANHGQGLRWYPR